jgi:L-ascorbate metabolism protein UlaG (beta-lactamase superfamily)
MGLSRQIRFEVDGVSILHTGDLGTLPDEEQLARLRPVDLLLLPVGGTYTIGPSEAVELVQRLRPRWTVPMHFRHPKVDLEMASRDVFVDALPSDTLVNQVPGSDWICQADDPSAVILLEPAL